MDKTLAEKNTEPKENSANSLSVGYQMGPADSPQVVLSRIFAKPTSPAHSKWQCLWNDWTPEPSE